MWDAFCISRRRKSSGEEYTQDISCEENCAAYTVRAQAIAAGEELCRSYFNMGYETIVLRLDHLYGEPLTGAEARDICARMSVEGWKPVRSG